MLQRAALVDPRVRCDDTGLCVCPAVPGAEKFYFDGVGDTYLHEVSADKVDLVVGGQTILEVAEGGGGASDYVAIQALNKLYLDRCSSRVYIFPLYFIFF